MKFRNLPDTFDPAIFAALGAECRCAIDPQWFGKGRPATPEEIARVLPPPSVDLGRRPGFSRVV